MSLPIPPRLALIPLLLAPLGATTAVEMSFEEAVARSEAIVHGAVVRSRSAWDPDRTAIWTHYDIRVQARLKGGSGAILTVSEPGGEIDGKRMQIVGAPRYEVGEEVVVFAASTPIGYLRTCGWGQGKLEVRPDASQPGSRVVRASPLAVQLVQAPRGKRGPAIRSFDGADLEGFLARVRALVAAQRARGEQ